jgi:homoserine dehydrogenase
LSPRLKVLLIGFGNVGQKLASVLTGEKHLYPGLQKLDPVIIGIATSSSRSLVSSDGLDLGEALRLKELHERGDPAFSHIRTALSRGRAVVTANKGPLAFHSKELFDLVDSQESRFLFESTVLDGTPLFNLARLGLRGVRIERIEGILNSTSNYVLGKMEEGLARADAVREAQERGFAEADPSLDLEGWDAAAKICVLCNTLMGQAIQPMDVARQGILGVGPKDFQTALDNSQRLKPIAKASLSEGRYKAQVMVEAVPFGHPFAHTDGSSGIVGIWSDLLGPFYIKQESPNLYDTAYGVLSDLLSLTDPM